MEIKEFWEAAKKWNDAMIQECRKAIKRFEEMNALADKALSGIESAEKSESK